MRNQTKPDPTGLISNFSAGAQQDEHFVRLTLLALCLHVNLIVMVVTGI